MLPDRAVQRLAPARQPSPTTPSSRSGAERVKATNVSSDVLRATIDSGGSGPSLSSGSGSSLSSGAASSLAAGADAPLASGARAGMAAGAATTVVAGALARLANSTMHSVKAAI